MCGKSTRHGSISRLAAVTVIFSKKKKKKKTFLDKVNGSMCAKFQVCIIFRLARRRDTNTYTNSYKGYQMWNAEDRYN